MSDLQPAVAKAAPGLFGLDQRAVANVGLAGFAAPMTAHGAQVVTLDWRLPAGGDPDRAWRLAASFDDAAVEAANATAVAAFLAAEPVLVGVGLGRDLLAALGAGTRRLLHAGPPIAYGDMCGPMQGGLIGAALLEGWAPDADSAVRQLSQGEIEVEPCHHHGAVGPMAGVISPSMPLWVVQERSTGRRSFSNLNEGLGSVLRFGANNEAVLNRLAWMRDELGPVLAYALAHRPEGLALGPVMAQALHMGDEVHNRNVAATGLFLRQLLPAMLDGDLSQAALQRVVAFIGANDHFFLNVSMAACHAMLQAAANIPNSTMVTVMARNGINFGIQISGTGSRWFEAPAHVVEGLFFPGYTAADAAADLGDSAITETAGLGGFCMAAAPAIARFVGGSPADALAQSRQMHSLALATNPGFTLPALDFAPTVAGIDIRRVLDSGVVPVINTGIAHRQAGVGQIGAGITHAPFGCFLSAFDAMFPAVPSSMGGPGG